MLPEILVAVVVFTLSIIIARFLRRWLNRILVKAFGNITIRALVSSIFSYTIIILGFFIALNILHLDKAVTSLLAGLGIVGLALGFAFQTTAANFIAGIMMAIRGPFQVGELIKTNDYYGTIREINLRTTKLETLDGELVMIPNHEVMSNPVENYSMKGYRRIDLLCGVSYDAELPKVKEVAISCIEDSKEVPNVRDVEFFYKEFGDSSINFELRIWIKFAKETDFLRARSEAVMILKKAFDREGIVIPFPIRTVYMQNV